MFFHILKKDLKRKKTMNIIVVLFVVLSAMFASSSVNNIVTVMGGIDNFMEKAGIADVNYYSTFDNCEITGNVDFIFGGGNATFNKCKIYSLKANGPLNSKIHGNAYTRVNNGLVRFLIKEQDARSMLLATKVGQRMSLRERVERLLPHEMTTKLFEEMANLRLKRGGTGLDIVLEQINAHYPKDKYSAFAYGLWRIKEIEEEQFKRKRRFSSGSERQLVFFTGGI